MPEFGPLMYAVKEALDGTLAVHAICVSEAEGSPYEPFNRREDADRYLRDRVWEGPFDDHDLPF